MLTTRASVPIVGDADAVGGGVGDGYGNGYGDGVGYGYGYGYGGDGRGGSATVQTDDSSC